MKRFKTLIDRDTLGEAVEFGLFIAGVLLMIASLIGRGK
jgi:hypothetical protein